MSENSPFSDFPEISESGCQAYFCSLTLAIQFPSINLFSREDSKFIQHIRTSYLGVPKFVGHLNINIEELIQMRGLFYYLTTIKSRRVFFSYRKTRFLLECFILEVTDTQSNFRETIECFI